MAAPPRGRRRSGNVALRRPERGHGRAGRIARAGLAGIGAAGAGAAAVGGLQLGLLLAAERRAVVRLPAPAEAIVVFGAAVYEDGPSVELRARLDHALRLWQEGVAPVVMVAGGIADGIDEIAAMARYLAERGMPPGSVEGVRPARTTRETIRTLAACPGRAYLAVSSPYHARRIEVEARRQGVRLAACAPPSTPENANPRVHAIMVAFELIGMAWYALPPAWTGSVATGPGTLRHLVPALLADLAVGRKLGRRR
jgi:uncharacterized SAM-binding protein YcdF (DUF218 family)